MTKNKILTALLIALVLFICIASANAADADDADIIQSSDANVVSVSLNDADILSAGTSDYYVTTTGSDENNGTQTSPFATIGKAISSADESKDVTVYLGEGTFKEEGNVDLEIALSNVASGGSITFIGVDGKTIIDGENLKPIFKSISANSIVTIQNIKFINAISPAYTPGGAINSEGYLTVDNCVFENCYAYESSGGAIYAGGSNDVTVTNSVFNNTYCDENGGAILAEPWDENSKIIIERNTFINCWNGNYCQGAALYVSGSGTTKVNENKFYNISSSGNKYDAGLYVWARNGEVINNTFENCIFTGNNGGVLYVAGTDYLSGNKFINSTALNGLIYADYATMNYLIKVNDVVTTSPTFTLSANITDIDGNTIYTGSWANNVHFTIGDETLNQGTGVINGTSTLEVTKLMDNGDYVINASFPNTVNCTFVTGTLTVNIDRTPAELWVDDAKGEDVETAGNETNPYKSIKYAINQGLAKSLFITIHINDGVYSGENNTDLSINALCDITILGESKEGTIIDGESLNRIFSLTSPDTVATIKDISLINAKTSSNGGAINGQCSLTVDNCIFINDTANRGGAIYLRNTNLPLKAIVSNSKFIKCSSDVYISYNTRTGVVTFVNNTIINTTNSYSSYIYAGNMYISNNTFANSLATSGNAFYLYVLSYGNITIDANKFMNVSSSSVKSIINLMGNKGTSAFITNNEFDNIKLFTSGYAGAIYLSDGGNVYLKNNTFKDSTISSTIFYNGACIANTKIVLFDNQTTSHKFTLTANVTDVDGNPITANSYYNTYVHFYANGTEIGKTKDIKNGVVTLEASKILENGIYDLTASIELLNVTVMVPATLTVNIAVNPKDYYISENGDDENGDGTQAKPFKTLKKALDQAYSVDKSYDVTIHVLDGTLSGEGNVNLTLNDSCAGVLTIVGENYGKAIFDGKGDASLFWDKSKPTTNAIPSTLKVAFENLNFINFASSEYYAVFIISGASELNFTNCIFDSFYYYGGNNPMFTNPNGDMNIKNSIFNNLSTQYSYIIGAWNPLGNTTIDNSIFTNINAGYCVISGINELYNSEFINCTSNGYNSDEYPIVYVKTNAILENNTFINNTAVGGIIRANAATNIINNTFIGNTIKYRSVINAKADVNITKSKFIDNTGNMGDAIYANAYVNLADVTFENNIQSGSLNDIYLDNNGKVSGLTLKFNDIKSNQYMNDIIAEIISDDGAIVTGGNVEFYVNDTSVGKATVTNSMAMVTYKFGENGNFLLNGTYNKADDSFIIIPGEAVINAYPVEFTDLYVSDSKGSDDNDGSINSPFKTIKKAVYYADGHENVTIHVLEGTYKGIVNTNIIIDNNLNIVGDGIDKTIIDGENVNYFFDIQKGNVVIKNFTMIKGYAPESYKLQITIRETSSLVLENVKYDNNTARALSFNNDNNLGISNYGSLTVINSTFNNNNIGINYMSDVIYSQYNSVLRIYNSTFSNNGGYGTIFIQGATTAIIENCNFTNHDALHIIYSNGNNPIIITSCNFVNNAANCIQGNVEVTDSTFIDNHYSSNNMGWNGVGIDGSGYVSDCIFINNTAYGNGGAMKFYNGEIYNCEFYNNTAASMSAGAGGAIVINGQTTIGNCYFEGNQALASGGSAMTTGGGAIMNYGNLIVMDCTFVDNYAVHRGGAIRNGEGYDNAVLSVYTSKFINNYAGNNGGAITSYMDPSQWSVIGTIHIHTSEFVNNTAGVTAGAIEIFRTNADIDECLFDGNTALNGGAISTSSRTTIATSNFTNNNAFSGGAIRIQGIVDISKCIFENNNASTGGAIDSVGGNINLVYSVFVNNTADSLGSAIFEGSANTYITDLSNNWWGINDDPNQFIYSNYTIESWVVANLIPELSEIIKGESVDFTVNFTDNNNTELGDSIPVRKVIVGEDEYDLADNTASFTFSADEAGMTAISVDNQVFELEVIKPTPEVEITFSKNPVYGNNITVTATVKGNDSTPTGSVVINVNGKDYEVNLTEGKAVAEIGILDANTYLVTAEYMGDENYANASASDYLTVSRARPRIEIHVAGIEYGQAEIVNITADKLFSDKLRLLINGAEHTVEVVNGSGSITFEGLTPNGYTVNTYFDGNSNYYGQDAGPVTFAVSKANVNLNITVNDITLGEKESIVIESTPKADGSLTIKLNGKMSSDSLVKGRCVITYKNLEVGDYEFVAVYAGNEYYNTATGKATFTVYPNNVVMNSTFFNFFDEEGVLRDNVTVDDLIFVGEFSNLGIDAIEITKSLDLIGDEAVLTDIGLIISADDVSLEDFTITLSNESGADSAIFVSGDDVTVENCVIDVVAPVDEDSIAIWAAEAENFALINNTIYYVGNTEGNGINNAIRLEESDGAVIENNTIDALIPAVNVKYDPTTWDANVMSEGILVDSSDDVVLSNNKINVDYNNAIGGANSIYAVEFVESDGALVSGNEITTKGKNYAYGLTMNGDDFVVDSNDITTTGDYYANGIQISNPGSGDVIANNIEANANGVSYPVYSYGTDVTYEDNNISGTANSVYGMELFGTEETVKDNNIVTNGNFTIGVASASKNLVLDNNTIVANGTNEGTPTAGDSIKSETTGVKVVRGNVDITNNDILSNGETAIKCDGSAISGNITDNNLVASQYTGDASVTYTPGNITVKDNTPKMEKVYINASDVEAVYGDNVVVNATVTDYEGNPVAGVPVNLTAGEGVYTENTDENGIATFDLGKMPAGNYTLDYSIDAEGYTKESCSANATITQKEAEITIDVHEPVKGEDLVINVTAPSDATGNVTATVNGKNYTAPVKDGKATVAVPDLDVGDYTVDVAYSGDDNYSPVSQSVNATVLADIIINAPDVTKYYNGPESFVVTVTDGEGKALSGKSVNITIDDESYVETTDSNGSASVDLDLGVGVYNVTVIVDDKAAEAVVTVLAQKVSINASDVEAVYGDNVIVNATVTDSEGNPVAGVPVKLTAANGVYTENTDENGIATFDLGKMPAGNYTLDYSINSQDYTNATCSANAVVTQKEANVTIDVNEPVKGEDLVINVTAPSDATGNVTATVNGKNYTAPVKDGKATIAIPDLDVGDYTVDVAYSGDDNYSPVSQSVNATVLADMVINAPDVTKYYGGSERFVVTVTDSKGKALANKTVKISINGVEYTRTTNANGTTTMALGLPSNVYNATVTVDNESVNSVVTILSTVQGNDLVKMFRNGTQYYATFFDSQGKPLASGSEVQFNINGVMYIRKTNENGTAKLNINLEPKTYIITATNPTNGEMHSNNITVLPIIGSSDLVKYYKNESQYVVTLYGEDGKAVGAGETVTFNINGVFYTRTTNATGQAKLNINLNPGNYTITAMYKECSVANNVEVKPVLTAKDLVKKYGTEDQFVATLVDGQGNPYAGQSITFNIHGVFYTRTTDANGQAKLNIRLMAGEYIITSMYSNGATIANTVKVEP